MTNMALNAQQMLSLDLDQTVSLIAAVGSKRTILAQGHMGTGKSSMLHTLAKMFPTHIPVYFDCTTKDLGDLALPDMVRVTDTGDSAAAAASASASYSTFVPNEELGLHLGKPVVVMLDEFGKANPAVKQGLTRFMLERTIGGRTLPEGSIVFATTNLGAEGVGDLFLAHQSNRMTVVTIRKPAHMDWIEWAINNSVDHSLLGWVRENPHLMQDFTEVKNPDENPYIFHPQDRTRVSFVTPRSLEAASDILHARTHAGLDDATVTAALAGTIGVRGAMDLMAFVQLANDLPTLQSIKTDPRNAKVPSNAAAVCMVVYRALSTMDHDWVNSWMDYLVRLPAEAQAMFAHGARSEKYSKRSIVMTSTKFTSWAMANGYLFSADIK